MHRHGYQGRKLHRERDQREALLKGLADSLVQYETIETTLPKAKEVVTYLEKLITKAKKGDLHNRREVISGLQTISNAHKLVDEIAPKLVGRTSGHLRIIRTSNRRGDNAQLARISFVDELHSAPVANSGESAAAAASPVSSVKSISTKPSTAIKKPKEDSTVASKSSKPTPKAKKESK